MQSTKAVARGGRLLQILGVGFGMAVIVGNTIGAGILRTPGEIAALLPNAGWFLAIWLAGGLYALLGAVSIAELGTMMPRSGGQYIFAREAMGDYAGFIVGWSDWLSTCGTSAAVAVVTGEYLGGLVPFLAGRQVAVAIIIVIGFALLQWRGVRAGSRFQEISSLLKALAFFALVGACFLFGGEAASVASAAPPSNVASSAAAPWVAIVLALQSVIYTYDGWAGVVYFSGEVRDPARDIPRSLFGGVLAVIVIYLLVNLALLYVLPIGRIAGEPLAMGVAADAIFGARGDTVIRIVVIISMLSGINAYHLMASRVLYGLGRDGLFSGRAAAVNEGGTPASALFTSAAVGVLFVLGGAFENSRRIFENIIAVLAFYFVFNYLMSFAAVFVLRRREPKRERPFRAWGYPVTTALSLIGSLAFLGGAIWADRRNSAYALLLLAASYPAFRWLRRSSRLYDRA